MFTKKCIHKLVVFLSFCAIITSCAEHTEKNTTATKATHSHSHDDGTDAHEHATGDHTHHDTPAKDHDLQGHSPAGIPEQANANNLEEEEDIELDATPIYEVGDIYKAIPARNHNGEDITFPSNTPQEKLLAFIDIIDEEKINTDESNQFLQSLDTFARRQNKVKVTVVNFLMLPEESKSYFKKLGLSHLDVASVGFEVLDELEVNAVPLYFKLDKENRITSILAGQHYSAEFD